MAGKVKAVPEGLRTVTPSLSVRDGNKALESYKKAFGAEVKGVFSTPDGKVAHAEFKIGGLVLMLADEFPDMGFAGPETIGEFLSFSTFTWRMSTRCSIRLSPPVPRLPGPWRINSGAIAMASLPIRLATNGLWRNTSKTCHPKRWKGAEKNFSPRWRNRRGRGNGHRRAHWIEKDSFAQSVDGVGYQPTRG